METVYSWFFPLFGSQLAEHLYGWDEVTQGYTNINLFNYIGFWMFIITATVCLTYYYILNHPRWNRGLIWTLILASVAIINFFIAFGICYYDLHNGYISSDLFVVNSDCIGFGFSNFIISGVCFFILSILIKWKSRNCKYTPF